jgi:hypothetical protein
MSGTGSVEIHNPSYATPPAEGGLRQAGFPRLVEGGPLRVGFLNNQKPNTGELLELVARGLGERYRVEARTFFKRDAAHPAPAGVIEDINRFADIAIISTAD